MSLSEDLALQALPEETSRSLGEKWGSFIRNRIHKPILKVLQYIARLSATNPGVTIVTVIALAFASFGIGLLTNFNLNVNQDMLWTPVGTISAEHSQWIGQANFPSRDLYFSILFHRNEGANVIGKDLILRMFDALELVQSTAEYHAMCSQSSYQHWQTNQSTCEILGPTAFWNNSRADFLADVETDQDVLEVLSNRTTPDGMPFVSNVIFGSLEKDEDGALFSAEAAHMYIIHPKGDERDIWEEEAVEALVELDDAWKQQDSTDFRLDVISDRSVGNELIRSIASDLPLAVGVFVFMSIFTALVFTNIKHRKQSRTLLGVAAVVSVFLSLLCGAGIMFMIGVPFTSITQVVPFMVFSIGLDDSFIMMGSFEQQYATSKDPVERIAVMVDDIGLSILLTTLTSAAAFALGCFSSVPAVFWLCQYCCPIIIMVLLFQLTFFVACMVLDERRASAGKPDCFASLFKTVDEEEDTNTTPVVERIMVTYSRMLLHPASKIIVVLGFVSLFLASCVSISQMTQEFKLTDVLPKESYAVDYIKNVRTFYRSEFTAVNLYFRNVDQSDPLVRGQMRNYTKSFASLDSYIPQTGLPFWFDAFDLFVTFQSPLNGTEKTFSQQLDAFLEDPVTRALFERDFVRDEDGNMVASKCQIILKLDYDDVQNQVDLLNAQKAITNTQEVNRGKDDHAFFAYTSMFNVWEFYDKAVNELIVTAACGVVAVSLVALLFIPHWTAVLFVLPLICVLYIDLLGFMGWCGIKINALSYICLTLSVGLMVDYLIHALFRYYELEGSRKEKTSEMLRSMGASILLGGTTTFLGMMLLIFSSSVAFTTIFVIFTGIVVVGVGHGLILLPVLLSCIGPVDEPDNSAVAPYKLPKGPSFERRKRNETDPTVQSSSPRATEDSIVMDESAHSSNESLADERLDI